MTSRSGDNSLNAVCSPTPNEALVSLVTSTSRESKSNVALHSANDPNTSCQNGILLPYKAKSFDADFLENSSISQCSVRRAESICKEVGALDSCRRGHRSRRGF